MEVRKGVGDGDGRESLPVSWPGPGWPDQRGQLSSILRVGTTALGAELPEGSEGFWLPVQQVEGLQYGL